MLIRLFFLTFTFILCTSTFAADLFTSMENAIIRRDLSDVQNMLLANTDGTIVKLRDARGNTLLHIAAGLGDLRMIQALIGAKSDVNAINKAGQTPLHVACEHTYQGNAKTLILAGSNVNAVDSFGRTPLLIVCDKGKPKMARDLLRARADVNATNKLGTTSLMFASARGNNDLVKTLLEYKANVNAIDNAGNNALHYAATKGRNRMIMFFPSLINTKNKAGQTPMDIAMFAGQNKFAEEIQKFGGRMSHQ